MDVKDVVARAKAYVTDLFSQEQIENVGLEEVEFDESEGVWRVTIGFSRPWDQSGPLAAAGWVPTRSYKIIRISQAGTVLSVKDRQRAAA